jgi:hypothetical protein
MPALKSYLHSLDSDFLSRIAKQWGIDIDLQDNYSAIDEIDKNMRNPDLLKEMLDSLPSKAIRAWESLRVNQGREIWAKFTRDNGGIREVGAAQRKRNIPEDHPISVTETLFYRGLIGRTFLNLPPEPREYAFIPDELLALPVDKYTGSTKVQIRPALKSETEVIETARTNILVQSTDWLAALRMGRSETDISDQAFQMREAFIRQICKADGLFQSDQLPDTDAIKIFLQTDRINVLSSWYKIWKDSNEINDLRMIPGFKFEGNWKNNPLLPRKVILDLLSSLDANTWWSFSSLVAFIKSNTPDFQRSGGEYDSWFIKKHESHDYLKGFDSWNQVEGELLKYLIYGPLHWLGLLDISANKKEASITAFKISALYSTITNPVDENRQPFEESGTPSIKNNLISIPSNTSRVTRYQIGRFCEIHSRQKEETLFKVTAKSMTEAVNQGLRPTQLLQILEKSVKFPIPVSLASILNRWEKFGEEISITKGVLVKVTNTEIMHSIKQNPRITKMILEELNSTTILIKRESVEVFQKEVEAVGFLIEVDL